MAKKTNAKNAGIGTPNGRTQTFCCAAPAALNVQLVGDFTQWQQSPINMRRDTDGIWRASVELSPGAHHYRFLVDGQWQDDPECVLHAPNPYGGHDAVRQVA